MKYDFSINDIITYKESLEEIIRNNSCLRIRCYNCIFNQKGLCGIVSSTMAKLILNKYKTKKFEIILNLVKK